MKRPAPIDNDPPGLAIVLSTLKSYNLTIWTFLQAFFTSPNEDINRQASFFFRHRGHVKLLNLWWEELDKQTAREALVSAAMGIVLDEIQLEFRRLGQDPILKRQSTSLQRKDIDEFSMSTVHGVLQRRSPCLVQLLQSLTQRPLNLAEPNSDSESEEVTNANIDPSNPSGLGSLSTSVLVPTIGSMLLYNKSRGSNLLQMVIGVHLFGCGCQTQVIELLTKVKLSVSPSTIGRALETLSNDAVLLAQIAAEEEPFILVCTLSYPTNEQQTPTDSKAEPPAP
ncbi:hypothetical protein BGZ89_008589 [Linnemannia elongata]|nr:hypothetical protein BGZ89_008589 [Linnemannia elongata]